MNILSLRPVLVLLLLFCGWSRAEDSPATPTDVRDWAKVFYVSNSLPELQRALRGLDRAANQADVDPALEALFNLRSDGRVRARLASLNYSSLIGEIEGLLMRERQLGRSTPDLRRRMALTLEREAMSALTARPVAELSDLVRREGGQGLGLPALNLLRHDVSLDALEALRRVRFWVQRKARSPDDDALLMQFAHAEMDLALLIGVRTTRAIVERVLLLESPLPTSGRTSNHDLEARYVTAIGESLMVSTAEAGLDDQGLKALLLRLYNEAEFLPLRRMARASMQQVNREFERRKRPPPFAVELVDDAHAINIEGLVNDGPVNWSIRLSDHQTVAELAEVDWEHVTFQLHRFGTDHLDWLAVYQRDPQRNAGFTVSPGSLTHKAIVGRLNMLAGLRELGTANSSVVTKDVTCSERLETP